MPIFVRTHMSGGHSVKAYTRSIVRGSVVAKAKKLGVLQMRIKSQLKDIAGPISKRSVSLVNRQSILSRGEMKVWTDQIMAKQLRGRRKSVYK